MPPLPADIVRYLVRPFDTTGTDDFRVTRFRLNWTKTWAQAVQPL